MKKEEASSSEAKASEAEPEQDALASALTAERERRAAKAQVCASLGGATEAAMHSMIVISDRNKEGGAVLQAVRLALAR